PEARGYIQEKMRAAAWLIKSIHQRQRTLYMVTSSIVKFQHDFLEGGVAFLRPLVLKDVANDIGMHESTVSRATAGKYVHTPPAMPPAPSRLKRGRLRDRGDGAMLITVTFRHVDPTPPLKAYAEEKLQRVRKYLHRPVDAHVILSVAKERHVAEITLKADHVTMFAEEETHDLYSAIDLAIDKLEHQ